MPAGAQQIPRVEVGGVSLVSAEYANKLIGAINAVRGARVAPVAGVGKFVVSESDFILDLSDLDARLRSLASGAELNAVYNTGGITNSNVLVSANVRYAEFRAIGVNGYLDFSALHNTLTSINSRLTNLIASINNANISANCNANTNAITVTLTFPNVPGV